MKKMILALTITLCSLSSFAQSQGSDPHPKCPSSIKLENVLVRDSRLFGTAKQFASETILTGGASLVSICELGRNRVVTVGWMVFDGKPGEMAYTYSIFSE